MIAALTIKLNKKIKPSSLQFSTLQPSNLLAIVIDTVFLTKF